MEDQHVTSPYACGTRWPRTPNVKAYDMGKGSNEKPKMEKTGAEKMDVVCDNRVY